MKRSTYIDRLARVPMFRALPKKDLTLIARHSDSVSVPAGRELTTEGTTGYEFFFIASGTATVKRKKRKVATLKAGDYFGELALLADVPRNATVVADTDMELYVVDRRQFSALVRDVPEIAVKLLKGLALRLSEADTARI
jgi:CRP/FNR family transcriptional regulator, cyclic AMP receptor protein